MSIVLSALVFVRFIRDISLTPGYSGVGRGLARLNSKGLIRYEANEPGHGLTTFNGTNLINLCEEFSQSTMSMNTYGYNLAAVAGTLVHEYEHYTKGGLKTLADTLVGAKEAMPYQTEIVFLNNYYVSSNPVDAIFGKSLDKGIIDFYYTIKGSATSNVSGCSSFLHLSPTLESQLKPRMRGWDSD